MWEGDCCQHHQCHMAFDEPLEEHHIMIPYKGTGCEVKSTLGQTSVTLILYGMAINNIYI